MKRTLALSTPVAFALHALLVSSAFAQAPAATAAPPVTAPTPVAAPAPAPDPRTRYVGNFTYVGGDRERQGLAQAIETATDGMNFIMRPIARGRLRDRNPVYSTVGIRLSPGFIEVLYDGRPFRSPDSGAVAAGRTVAGDAAQISQRFDAGNRLAQSITTDSGTRRSVFTLSADGSVLTMNVTVTSSSLPRPLNYTLTFRRH